MLRFVTAGESHGKGLVVIIEGLPRGVHVRKDLIEEELKRRRSGYGRGPRMKGSIDFFEILSGVKQDRTTGSPVAVFVANETFGAEAAAQDRRKRGAVEIPRPGHADLAGAMKLLTEDLSVISERASARETAARVAAGALFKMFLAHFKVSLMSHTLSVGRVSCDENNAPIGKIKKIPRDSPLRCVDQKAEKRMMREIDLALRKGDSAGGSFQIIADHVSPGLGSFTQWDRRVDALLAQALFSIPGVRAMEIGNGIQGAASFGSQFHDEIFYDRNKKKFFRKGNNAGGIEGGMTNGEAVRVRLFFKPVPTIQSSLDSVSLKTKKKEKASFVRSDTCPIVAASVVGESMMAYVLSRLFLEKFGGDTIAEALRNYNSYLKALAKLF